MVVITVNFWLCSWYLIMQCNGFMSQKNYYLSYWLIFACLYNKWNQSKFCHGPIASVDLPVEYTFINSSLGSLQTILYVCSSALVFREKMLWKVKLLWSIFCRNFYCSSWRSRWLMLRVRFSQKNQHSNSNHEIDDHSLPSLPYLWVEVVQ